MLANSLYLKNPENPNKSNVTVPNFLKSVGSPNFKTIDLKDSILICTVFSSLQAELLSVLCIKHEMYNFIGIYNKTSSSELTSISENDTL